MSKKYKKNSKTVKDRFVNSLLRDLSIDWDSKVLSNRVLILDVLYLLGISIDDKKYAQCSGFKKFLNENGIGAEMKLAEFASDNHIEEHSNG